MIASPTVPQVLYYEETLGYVLGETAYFGSFVLDIFGSCAQGYDWNECVPL